MNVLDNLNTLPFTCKKSHYINELINEYIDVEFTQDFGIFKKGEKYDSVTIDLGRDELNAFEKRSCVAMQEVDMKLVPKIV